MRLSRHWCRPLARIIAVALPLVGLALGGRSAAEPVCADRQPEAIPTGKGEQLIIDYFKAINDQDYPTAWGYLGRPIRAKYGAMSPDWDPDGLIRFSSSMRQRVSCVRVVQIANIFRADDPDVSVSGGIQWYQVELDAQYVAPFESGVGTLPSFYKTQADPHEPGAPPPLIIDQATTPA